MIFSCNCGLILFIIGYLIVSVFCSDRNMDEVLQSPRVTNWGDWGNFEFCPEQSFVIGMQLRLEATQGYGDDTALNAIKLICGDVDGKVVGTNITSLQASRGDWRAELFCRGGSLANGFQLRSEPDIGDGDDAAAINLKLFCATTEDEESKAITGETVAIWGDFTTKQTCPMGQAICGLRTQVKIPAAVISHQDIRIVDETSLNNIDIGCCKVPNPADTCSPATYSWARVTYCPSGSVVCTVAFSIGISYIESSIEAKIQMKNYEALGFSPTTAVESLMKRLTVELSNKIGDINISELITDVSDPLMRNEFVNLQTECGGSQVQQLILRCGSYQIKTKKYRCVINSGIEDVTTTTSKISTANLRSSTSSTSGSLRVVGYVVLSIIVISTILLLGYFLRLRYLRNPTRSSNGFFKFF